MAKRKQTYERAARKRKAAQRAKAARRAKAAPKPPRREAEDAPQLEATDSAEREDG